MRLFKGTDQERRDVCKVVIVQKKSSLNFLNGRLFLRKVAEDLERRVAKKESRAAVFIILHISSGR